MKVKTIDITAKEWFDRVNGNSYFSAIVIVNFGMKSTKSFSIPFQYGYDSHYVDIANQELIKENIVKSKRHENGSYPALWRYCAENNIILRTSKFTNCLKREVINFGGAK